MQELGGEKVRQLLGEGVDYLEFSSGGFEVELGGQKRVVRVFGTPVSHGRSFNQAFQDLDSLRRLETCTDKADILLTHAPLSSSMWTERLLRHLSLFKPSLHVCGHIHGYYGRTWPLSRYLPEGMGISVNASIMQTAGIWGQRPRNPPIVLDLRLEVAV